MLLTVFGMLSGMGNKRPSIYNSMGYAYPFPLTTASKRESIVLNNGASILACNIIAVLLISYKKDNGHIG